MSHFFIWKHCIILSGMQELTCTNMSYSLKLQNVDTADISVWLIFFETDELITVIKPEAQLW